MNMKEIENDIISDLEELSDSISQYTYLIECASTLPVYPKEYIVDEYRIKDCQANTWVYIRTKSPCIDLLIESESYIIKGALSLISEIYAGRTKEEVQAYECELIKHKVFFEHFTQEQIRGIRRIIKKLHDI